MPIIQSSPYAPPPHFNNCHINTIYAALFRNAPVLKPIRERIETNDGDFLDLDWSLPLSNDPKILQNDRIIICTHGLEGNSHKPYMRGMIHRFNREGFDAVALNLRGCSGTDNHLLNSYHSGKTEDLALVIDHVLKRGYRQIVLIGFSIGGNITLKYAGEVGLNMPKPISHVLAFAVPCDLAACSLEFEKAKNVVYLLNFLKTLREKALRKAKKFPNRVDTRAVRRAFTFRAFDDAFTAPVNGYADAHDYWLNASCLPLLPNIVTPTLLVSAKDDSFLAPSCYPIETARENPNFYLEMPEKGGHMGFMSPNTEGYLWSEDRAVDFVKNALRTE